MTSTTDAKAQIVNLATKALTITESKTLTTAEKMAQLKPIEKQIADAQNDLFVAEKRSQFVGLGDRSPAGARVAARGLFLQAPQLTPGSDDQLELFKSVRSGMPYTTKSALDAPDITPGMLSRPIANAFEPTRILDLMPVEGTDRPSMDYYVSTLVSAADAVGEGELKPAMTGDLARQNAGATKIAHYAKVNDEALEDFAPFTQFLSNDMIAGLIDAENREILSGSGVGDHKFKGLTVVGGTNSYERLTDDTILDALEIAGTQLRVSGRYTDPTGFIMHPLDYSRARRTKSTTKEYIAGDPTQAGPATLWGVPVIVTTEIPEHMAIAANFAVACQAWIRLAPTIRTNQGGDTFQRNQHELVAEERIIFAVTVPAAISIVDISDPT